MKDQKSEKPILKAPTYRVRISKLGFKKGEDPFQEPHSERQTTLSLLK